ncbi:hypothetical protein EMPG_14503 [Blastomyces silverae]|uniref:Uncharacterized protein n=1 Tax=Blastomyces silverae TaxID=2060906 RepID=A0A0H1BG48_9EURO|nr:hypothetical protein EMPG_14503 [Blastomyces silverae]
MTSSLVLVISTLVSYRRNRISKAFHRALPRRNRRLIQRKLKRPGQRSMGPAQWMQMGSRLRKYRRWSNWLPWEEAIIRCCSKNRPTNRKRRSHIKLKNDHYCRSRSSSMQKMKQLS